MIPTLRPVGVKPKLPWDAAAIRDHILKKTRMVCSSGVWQTGEVVDFLCIVPHVCTCSRGVGWQDCRGILKLMLKKHDGTTRATVKLRDATAWWFPWQWGLGTEESVFVDTELGYVHLGASTLHGFVFVFSVYANYGTYRNILTYNIRIFICLNYNTPYVNASVLHCVTIIICTMVGPQVSTSDQGSNLLGNARTHNGKHSLPWEKHTLNWQKQLRVGKGNRARVPFRGSLTSSKLKFPWSRTSNPNLPLPVGWLKLAHSLTNCTPAGRRVGSVSN